MARSKRTWVFAGVGAALLLLLVAGAAFALGGIPGAAAQPGTPGTPGTPATGAKAQACADFQQKLAANLGVSEDKLRAALKQTATQEVDEALAAGRITADQAQRLKDRIDQSDGKIPCPRLGKGADGRHGQMVVVLPAMLDAAATYLGTDRATLLQELRDQGSLERVTALHGKDKDGLERAMADALRQTLTAKGLDQARVDQIVNQFEQNFDQLYTRDWKQRGPGARPGGAGFPAEIAVGFGLPFGDLDDEFDEPFDAQQRGPFGGQFSGPWFRPVPAPAATPAQ